MTYQTIYYIVKTYVITRIPQKEVSSWCNTTSFFIPYLWLKPCITKSFLSTWEYIYPLLDLSNLFYSYVPFCSFSFSKVYVNLTFSKDIFHIMINQFIYQKRVSITRVTRHHLHNSQDFTRQYSTDKCQTWTRVEDKHPTKVTRSYNMWKLFCLLPLGQHSRFHQAQGKHTDMLIID